MYDWANSVYSLVITTTVFPIYFSAIARKVAHNGLFDVFGVELRPGALFSFTLSAAFLTIALINPALSGIADAAGRRLTFMKRFCWLGALSCMGLALFTEDDFFVGPLFFYLATVGFSGSLVFYNAYLPQLAPPDKRDDLSAKGFSYGYVGSVLLQILVLVPILMPDLFGTTTGTATRWAFVATGIWWLGFAQIPFARLPQDARSYMPLRRAVGHGFKVVTGTFNRIRKNKLLTGFLVAYLFYNMGVQTIMYLATIFGEQELHLTEAQLIPTLLGLQILAIVGALGTARASDKWGPVPVLTGLLLVWMGICLLAYFITTANDFYILAGLVGLMMGGIQSLSRSTWARFLPLGSETRATSYFSFFDLVDKISVVGGTLVYGLVETLTGTMRTSALALGLFFGVGILLLQQVRRSIYPGPAVQKAGL
jgi:UMF1 family MFS transporter